MRQILTLMRGDAKNVARDPLLTYIPVVPFFLMLGLRLLIPWLTGLLAGRLDLTEYYTFIAGFLLLMTPLMVGMVAGFILLDERDENVLDAIGVTPFTKGGFLLYRMSSSTLLSFLLNLLLVNALGLVPGRLLPMIPPALIAALEAPLLALFVAAVAGNKVEGLVLAKGSGLLILAPLAIIFIPLPWQYLAGIMPSYWIMKAFLAIYDANFPSGGLYWIYTTIALLVHLGLLAFFLRSFNRRVG